MSLIQIGSSLSRRNFLSGCAASTACAHTALAKMPAPTPDLIPKVRTRLRLVFLQKLDGAPGWPYIDFDYASLTKELAAKLRAACPQVDFLTATARDIAEMHKILDSGSEVDGHVGCLLGGGSKVARTLAESGQPVLLVNYLYGGSNQFLKAYAAAKHQGLRVAGVTSSRFEDVVQAVKAFECLAKLRASTILDVTNKELNDTAYAIQDNFGTKVVKLNSDEINRAYAKVDRDRALNTSRTWMSNARRIVEPSKEEIENAAVMYVAMRDLLAERKAQGITVDCLELVYGGNLLVYPCLGFFQLNNDGLVGACEADLQSTITMLAMTYLVGRPGYISDPVIDTSKNQIIYAHCVGTNKVYGPDGPANPYDIRSHSEDRRGAAVRSLMPLGQAVSTLKFDPVKRQVIFHEAKTVANIEDERACRTKLAAEVKDPYKLLAEWDRWDWHRVTFYGAHRQAVETFCALSGFQVVMEG